VYVKELTTGGLTLASTDGAGTKGDNSSANASLAGDASAVAFDSFATNLDPADGDLLADVYVKDLDTDGLTLASTSSASVKGDGISISPSLSGDGTLVAFSSASTNLSAADADATLDIFVKDVTTGAVTLASTDDEGTKGNGDSSEASISADGTRVAFTSTSTNLDPADTESDADVYVKDLVTGDLVLASTPSIGEKGNGADAAPSLSADGSAVAFSSFSTNLDPADADLAERLRNGNLAYEERFGRIYLARAKGRSGEELLALLEHRLGNDPATELGVTKEQLAEIALLRLTDLVEDATVTA
jgi:OHCU decarboxylase